MSEPYTAVVRNPDAESENRIHSDEVARAYGFRGALVPGVVVYAHMCPAIAGALGPRWLERGAAEVRFRQPVYDGDRVTVAADEGDAGAVWVKLRNGSGEECAVARAWLPESAAEPELTGLRLTTIRAQRGELPDSAEILRLANRVVTAHFQISPWIHAGSRLRHLGRLPATGEVELDAGLRSLTERGGHKFADLHVLVRSAGAVIAEIEHTVIYEPAKRPVTA